MPRYDYDGWLDGMAQKRPLLRRSMAEGSRHLCIASPQSSPCTYLYMNLQHPSVLPFSPAFVLPWLVVDFADRDVEAGFARRIWLEEVST